MHFYRTAPAAHVFCYEEYVPHLSCLDCTLQVAGHLLHDVLDSTGWLEVRWRRPDSFLLLWTFASCASGQRTTYCRLVDMHPDI